MSSKLTFLWCGTFFRATCLILSAIGVVRSLLWRKSQRQLVSVLRHTWVGLVLGFSLGQWWLGFLETLFDGGYGLNVRVGNVV